ncbi:amino acid/polyamine transporter I [Suillus ampliporus]|nr:amino acid/polyamine transporter I [Suillus ampliporus]
MVAVDSNSWDSRGLVVLLGFLQAVYTLEGCETAAQVAEEAVQAEILAPLAVVGSIAGSWLIGLAYLLALLFAVQDIASVQATTFTIPIAQLFYDAVGPQLTQMCLILVAISQVMATITTFTASSRLFYALVRDDAFPLKKQYMTLNRFQAPYWGVWTSVLIGCIISCAYIGSAIAFNAILSSAAISVMLSYLQPLIIRVFWPSSIEDFGPFRLGKWSWPVNFASFLFTGLVCILFILPMTYPVDVLNMNYSIVAVGGLLVVITINWFWWGRHSFKGLVKTVMIK